MAVFDFNSTSDDNKKGVCTYTTFRSNNSVASADAPIMYLDNKNRQWKHHSSGVFTNPIKRTSFEFNEEEKSISATCLVKLSGKTGVEMEALTGVNVALLTIYDMCKAIDKGMVISDVHLVKKSGGKSGDFYFNEEK